MAVKSREMKNGVVAGDRPHAFAGGLTWFVGGALDGVRRIVGLGPLWPLGLVLVVAGALGWVAGARFTAEGWPRGITMIVAALFSFDLGLQVPRGRQLLGAALAFGLFYSWVEVRLRPFRYVRPKAEDGQPAARGHWHIAPPAHWVAWLIVVATDVGTTFVGVAALVLLAEAGAEVWPIFLEIAASRDLNGAASLVLTFAPELSIMAGWRLLWTRRPA